MAKIENHSFGHGFFDVLYKLMLNIGTNNLIITARRTTSYIKNGHFSLNLIISVQKQLLTKSLFQKDGSKNFCYQTLFVASKTTLAGISKISDSDKGPWTENSIR